MLLACVPSVLLTVPHMQAGQHAAPWARDSTNRHLLGCELPVPYVASLHAGLVLAVSLPLLARALLHLKTAPGRQRLPPNCNQVAATGLAYIPLVIARCSVPTALW